MNKIHKIILTITTFLLVIISAWIIINIGPYYLSPLAERPHIKLIHKLWKPGGTFGHGLGIVGGGMMLLMFIYSIRKRVKFFRKWGKLPTWLNYHIFLGIAGPILVTFHTAIKFGGLVSISYWSMVAVALSGFIGRYIYIKIPHRVSGKEITREDFKEKLQIRTDQFKKEFDISDSTVERIRELSGADKIKKRGLLGIFTIFFMDISFGFKWQKIKTEISKSSSISRKEMKQFKHSLKQIVKMDRQIAFWHAAQSLFHYWHVIHKPFAYTMIVIMFVHITVAVSLGYTWVF
ncbi:MAG: hypothetical protein ACE5D0_07010 [Fidelibacterota bacterium]